MTATQIVACANDSRCAKDLCKVCDCRAVPAKARYPAFLEACCCPQEWNKAHLINHLAEVHGYRRYLELCSSNSGRRYGEIDRAKLLTTRLMYCCPGGYDDGLAIDYRSPTLDIGECLATINEEGRGFDIALVDSWHEFEPSWRDLVEGFRLIRADGTLVVHDCLPAQTGGRRTQIRPGRMVRRQLSSYVDFISQRHDLAVYTVDTDYGCGVIRKLADPSPESATAAGAELLGDWRSKRDDPMEAFAFFQAHKQVLLNLITADEFFARERS